MITDYQHQLPHTPVIGTLTHRTAALQTNEDFSHLQLPAPLHDGYNVYVDGDGERGAEEDDCLVMRAATGATICPQGPTSHLDTDTLHCYIHYTSQQSAVRIQRGQSGTAKLGRRTIITGTSANQC